MQEQKIINNVRKYRKWKDITQESFCKKIKISINQLRKIENEAKYPKYQVRSRICEYFNVTPDQMFYFE